MLKFIDSPSESQKQSILTLTSLVSKVQKNRSIFYKAGGVDVVCETLKKKGPVQENLITLIMTLSETGLFLNLSLKLFFNKF